MKQILHKEEHHRSVWSYRDVRLILSGRTLALAGSATALVTLLLQSHERGVGTLGVAALLVCMALPTIGLMGVAGRLTDTHDSRTLLSAGIGLQVLALLVLAWSPEFAVTLGGVFALAVGQAVTSPTWTALLPRVVGEENVGSAIAWQQGLGAVATPIGAAAGGLVYGWAGPTPALLGATGTLAVLWLTVYAIRTRRHVSAEVASEASTTVPTSSRILAGVGLIRADRVIWPTFLALIPMVVMAEGVNAVEIFLARDTLGATPQQYGLGELAAGAGGVAGAALAARLRGDRAWVRATLGGFALACAALALAGAAPTFWFYLAVMVVVAAAVGVGNAANGALIVTRTPDARRGTVGAALSGIARAASVVALGLGGLIGTMASPRTVFIVGGLAGMLAVLGCGWRAITAVAREQAKPPSSAAPVDSGVS